MNVLVYVPQMAPYGGMERHVCGLAGALALRGHRVDLLTTSNSLGPDLRGALSARNVALRELPLGRDQASRRAQAGRKAFWLLLQALRARGTVWDILYTNGQSGLARLAWLSAGRRTRIVHHHHTAADPSEQAGWAPAFRRVLERAPELVACSRATQQALSTALGRNDVQYLPYLAASPVEASEVEERIIEPGAPLHFGFLGRLVREKGIDALRALSRRPELAEITWHVHGAGSDYPAEGFADYPKVVYHGLFNGAKEQALALSRLDALVLFSTHNEGMPLSLIEGMSAGLPWIATDRGGTRELALSPSNCLLVQDPHDLEGLSAAVLEMVRRLRCGGASRLEQRRAYDGAFSPAAVTGAWSDYFERAPSERRP